MTTFHLSTFSPADIKRMQETLPIGITMIHRLVMRGENVMMMRQHVMFSDTVLRLSVDQVSLTNELKALEGRGPEGLMGSVVTGAERKVVFSGSVVTLSKFDPPMVSDHREGWALDYGDFVNDLVSIKRFGDSAWLIEKR